MIQDEDGRRIIEAILRDGKLDPSRRMIEPGKAGSRLV